MKPTQEEIESALVPVLDDVSMLQHDKSILAAAYRAEHEDFEALQKLHKKLLTAHNDLVHRTIEAEARAELYKRHYEELRDGPSIPPESFYQMIARHAAERAALEEK